MIPHIGTQSLMDVTSENDIHCGNLTSVFTVVNRLSIQAVPIPVVDGSCTYSCCTRSYVPLTLAYARTIHKFQGLSAGPVDKGKIPNMYKRIICDPDAGKYESTCTGLLYTALSRATTLGDANGLNSAIYFIGEHFRADRIRYIGLSLVPSKNFEEYKNFTRRREWTQHIKHNTRPPLGVSASSVFAPLFAWSSSTRFSYNQLYDRTKAYVAARAVYHPDVPKAKPTKRPAGRTTKPSRRHKKLVKTCPEG